jgi:hypothetical protein
VTDLGWGWGTRGEGAFERKFRRSRGKNFRAAVLTSQLDRLPAGNFFLGGDDGFFFFARSIMKIAVRRAAHRAQPRPRSVVATAPSGRQTNFVLTARVRKLADAVQTFLYPFHPGDDMTSAIFLRRAFSIGENGAKRNQEIVDFFGRWIASRACARVHEGDAWATDEEGDSDADTTAPFGTPLIPKVSRFMLDSRLVDLLRAASDVMDRDPLRSDGVDGLLWLAREFHAATSTGILVRDENMCEAMLREADRRGSDVAALVLGRLSETRGQNGFEEVPPGTVAATLLAGSSAEDPAGHELFRTALARKNSPEGLYAVARCVLAKWFRADAPHDPPSSAALERLRSAVTAGSPEATTLFALLQAGNANPEVVLGWLAKAAMMGEPQAQRYLRAAWLRTERSTDVPVARMFLHIDILAKQEGFGAPRVRNVALELSLLQAAHDGDFDDDAATAAAAEAARRPRIRSPRVRAKKKLGAARRQPRAAAWRWPERAALRVSLGRGWGSPIPVPEATLRLANEHPFRDLCTSVRVVVPASAGPFVRLVAVWNDVGERVSTVAVISGVVLTKLGADAARIEFGDEA